jgi:hypothetical protein
MAASACMHVGANIIAINKATRSIMVQWCVTVVSTLTKCVGDMLRGCISMYASTACESSHHSDQQGHQKHQGPPLRSHWTAIKGRRGETSSCCRQCVVAICEKTSLRSTHTQADTDTASAWALALIMMAGRQAPHWPDKGSTSGRGVRQNISRASGGILPPTQRRRRCTEATLEVIADTGRDSIMQCCCRSCCYVACTMHSGFHRWGPFFREARGLGSARTGSR